MLRKRSWPGLWPGRRAEGLTIDKTSPDGTMPTGLSIRWPLGLRPDRIFPTPPSRLQGFRQNRPCDGLPASIGAVRGWSLERPLMGSIGARPAAELSSLFGGHLSPLLPELPSLFRAHLSPLLPEFLAAFGRKAFEPLPPLAKHPAFFRGELAKSLKSLSNPFLLFRRYLLPPLESFAGLLPLFGSHACPPISPFRHAFLPCRWQLIPGFLEGLEDPLFLRRELVPGNPRGVRFRPGWCVWDDKQNWA